MSPLCMITRLRRTGLDFESASILLYIPDGGRVTPGALAKALRINRSHVTRVLTRLQEKRLITRRTDAHDRRCVQVELTRAGTMVKTDLAKEPS